MELSNEQYERLCNFLDANMSMEEMAAFEKELANDDILRSQLNFELSVRNNFLGAKENNIKEPTQEEKKIIKLPNRNNWWKAAAAALILGLSIFYFSQTNKTIPVDTVQHKDTLAAKVKDTGLVKIQPEKKDTTPKIDFVKLFDDNFVPDKIPENYPIQLAAELTEYEKGDYTSMGKLDIANISEIRGGRDKQAIQELAHYYKGISLVKLGKLDDAIANLQWVKNNATTDSMKANARWYLALGYLKKENTGKAKVLLEGIGSYGRYKKEVKKIIQLIE